MQIYVCVKHVPDSAATITIKGENEIEETITFILNPYDENGVEAGTQLKARAGAESEVIAVTVGPQSAENTLRSALAMGADRGILIQTNTKTDSMITARALKKAILNDGDPAIVIGGKVSIDTEGYQTLFRLASFLNLPVASPVAKLELEDDGVLVECEGENGEFESVRLTLPAVIGVGKGLNKPRYPTLPDIMKSKKKPIKMVALEDLDLQPSKGTMEITRLRPAVETRQPKEITGSPQEAADRLVRILKDEAKVI